MTKREIDLAAMSEQDWSAVERGMAKLALAVDRLRDAMTDLENTLSEFGGALEPVLRPVPPEPGRPEGESAKNVGLAPLADELASVHERVIRVRARLLALRERLEL